MRFKKLRIILGVSLIIFILFVGNVLVFGKLLDQVNTKEDIVKEVTEAQGYVPIEKNLTIEKNKTSAKNVVKSPVTVTKPTPTVVVTKKKTRAS